MNFKSKWLSNNTKVGASLDVSRQDANCINSCHAASYCYINDNIQDKINEDLSPTRNLRGLHLKIVAAIAIIWSLFQLWYASPFPFIFAV